MKSVLSFLYLLVVGLVAARSYGVDFKTDISATAFTISCVDAVNASRDSEIVPNNLKDFMPEESIKVGREKREVRVFRLKPNRSPDNRIVGVIERGPETDVEIPQLTAICLNEVPHPSTSKKSGEIEFKSGKGKTTMMRFHLNKKSGDPGYLKYTSWKTTGNDSVWMIGPFQPNVAHDPPGPKDWPSCMTSKAVTLTGADISFDFSGCTNAGSSDELYEYALHMDQTSGSASVDIGIDPQIINHP